MWIATRFQIINKNQQTHLGKKSLKAENSSCSQFVPLILEFRWKLCSYLFSIKVRVRIMATFLFRK